MKPMNSPCFWSTWVFVALSFLFSPMGWTEGNLMWVETESSIGLESENRTLWEFHFERESSKPYFHPIGLADGTPLTWAHPPDHRWHLGLWFSWKFINGLNYWEEDRNTGLSEGRTTVESIRKTLKADHSAELHLRLAYHPVDRPPVLIEERSLFISAPDASGGYRIDWRSDFAAWKEGEVLLDRTPLEGEPEGKSWGGYAGLSIRLAEDSRNWNLYNSEGGHGVSGTSAKRGRWCCCSLTTGSGATATIAILDHPENPRSPTPWYTISQPDVPFGYFSPAVLYEESMRLDPGQSFSLRYRIWISPTELESKKIESEYQNFIVMEENR